MLLRNKILYVFVICLLFPNACDAQGDVQFWVKKFDNTFYTDYKDNKLCSYDKYKKLSTSRNAYHFMPLSYGINALNIMYETTGDIKYIEANSELIENVVDASTDIPGQWSYNKKVSAVKPVDPDTYKGWIVRSKNVGPRVKGRDWMLYEGYLYRYVMQYLYILENNEIPDEYPEYQKLYNKILSYVETNIWDKWQERSMQKEGDYSKFFTIRTHMGSHWGAIALYLNELTDNSSRRKVAQEVIDGYNQLLKNNFKIREYEGHPYYTWNSSFDNLPSDKHNNKPYLTKAKNAIVQDVTHGNQVVDYIITAYELNNRDWTKEDITKLSNTVRYSIWDKDKKEFSDYLMPTEKVQKRLEDTGFKQSNGWLKLAAYDANLQELYEIFFKYNESKLKTSHLLAQFYAQMANNYRRNTE